MLIGVLVSWFMGKTYLNYKVNIFCCRSFRQYDCSVRDTFPVECYFGANGNFVSDKVQP